MDYPAVLHELVNVHDGIYNCWYPWKIKYGCHDIVISESINQHALRKGKEEYILARQKRRETYQYDYLEYIVNVSFVILTKGKKNVLAIVIHIISHARVANGQVAVFLSRIRKTCEGPRTRCWKLNPRFRS